MNLSPSRNAGFYVMTSSLRADRNIPGFLRQAPPDPLAVGKYSLQLRSYFVDDLGLHRQRL